MRSTPVKQSRNPVLRRFEHGVVSKNTDELKTLCLPFLHPRARNLISAYSGHRDHLFQRKPITDSWQGDRSSKR